MAQRRLILLSILFRIAVCVVLLVVAFAIFGLMVKTKPKPQRTSATQNLPLVKVMQARPVSVKRQWEGYGVAESLNSADIPARVTATVLEIPSQITPGNPVGEGQLIVQLDDRDYRHRLNIAEQDVADLESQLQKLDVDQISLQRRVKLAGERVELSQTEYDRTVAAEKKGGAKPREVDAARQLLVAALRDLSTVQSELDKLTPLRQGLTAKKQSQATALALAQLDLERCRIESPIAGVIQSIDVEVGENLVLGQRVARVVDVSHIEVMLRLPAGAREHVRLGDEVLLRTSGIGERVIRSEVTRISPEDDAGTRTMGIYVEWQQDVQVNSGLRPGQFVRGTVVSAENSMRWIVPRRAVLQDRIQLVRDNKIASWEVEVDFQIEAHYPELGFPDVQWIVLRKPLQADDLIVVTASDLWTEGMTVEANIAEPLHAENLNDREVNR